jgi:drug/metabolite transporter (DMT)-like permease
MTPKHRLQLKTYILIVVMVLFGPLGNLLLGKGMKHVGALAAFTPVELFRFVSQAMSSKTVWIGIGSLIAFFIANSLVLSWADYSYVQPTSSIAYGSSALLGHLVLHEKVSLLQWAGILTICLGVFIVGRTPPSTTNQEVKHG